MGRACSVCGEPRGLEFPALDLGLCPRHLHELLADTFSEMGVDLEYDSCGGDSVCFRVPSKIEYMGDEYGFPDWEFHIRAGDGDYAHVYVYTDYDYRTNEHPHCSGGNCCLGSNYELLQDAIRDFDWAQVVALATIAACTYTPHGAYRRLVTCDNCGETADHVCPTCEHTVCEDCYSESTDLCVFCGTRCQECYTYVQETFECEECGDRVCTECAHEVEVCQACGSDAEFCECDEDTQDIATIYLCGYHYRQRYPRPARQPVPSARQVASPASSGDQWVRLSVSSTTSDELLF